LAANVVGPGSQAVGAEGDAAHAAHACSCPKTDAVQAVAAHPIVPTPTAPACALTQPDFARMTQAEKLAYQKARRDRIWG